MKRTLIPLLIVFLISIQIARGQNSLITTTKQGKLVCVRASLMDTIIHDLQERKLLLLKDSIQTGQISILTAQNQGFDKLVLQKEKSLVRSEMRRKRNGWQRNFFILVNIVLVYSLVR